MMKKKDVGSSCLLLRVPPQVAASQRFFGKNLFTVHELILRITKLGSEHSTGFRNPYQERRIYICVEIYTHPRISQRDFPVMRFIALQHKSKKDDK